MVLNLTFRTLKGDAFKLQIEPAETVLDMKRKVASRQSVEDFAAYRLIYKGKILADDATVSAAGVSEAGFLVVMPPKKAVPAKKPAEPPVAAPSAAETPQAAPASEQPEAMDESATPVTAPAATAPANAAGASSLVTGPQYDESVKQICEMGFPEDQVKKALRAAFNNPDRAVDYLFNGIPETPAEAAPRAATPAASATPAPSATPATAATNAATPAAAPGTPFNMFEAPAAGGGGGGGGGGAQPTGPGSLDFLRHLPQFNIMRRLIHSNPEVFPQLLQQLDQSHPDLLAMINANHAEFVRLINEPVQEGEDGGDEAMEELAQAMAGAGGPGGPGGPTPGQVFVTEEENEQIDRLADIGLTMGLVHQQAVEAWLVCERDETAAANYLVDNAEELRAAQEEEAATQRQQEDTGPGGGAPPQPPPQG